MRLALGPILSIVIGLGLAFFLESMDHSVKSRAEAEEYLDTPVLATIAEQGERRGRDRGRCRIACTKPFSVCARIRSEPRRTRATLYKSRAHREGAGVSGARDLPQEGIPGPDRRSREWGRRPSCAPSCRRFHPCLEVSFVINTRRRLSRDVVHAADRLRCRDQERVQGGRCWRSSTNS